MAVKSVLTDQPENLIRKFKTVLNKNKIPVEKIILFGSYARGKQKYWSDLDLCIVSKTFGKDGHDELVLLKQLSSDVDPMIEAFPYHPDDLKDRYDSFAREILAHGKVIV